MSSAEFGDGDMFKEDVQEKTIPFWGAEFTVTYISLAGFERMSAFTQAVLQRFDKIDSSFDKYSWRIPPS